MKKNSSKTNRNAPNENLGKCIISIKKDHKKVKIQGQCCRPGPCSPKW